MTMTLEEYQENAKKNELYTSWWKLCKDKLDNAIQEDEKKCKILIPMNDSTLNSCEAEVIAMISNSINMVYNCSTVTSLDKESGLLTIDADWGDNVVPYRKEIQ